MPTSKDKIITYLEKSVFNAVVEYKEKHDLKTMSGALNKIIVSYLLLGKTQKEESDSLVSQERVTDLDELKTTIASLTARVEILESLVTSESPQVTDESQLETSNSESNKVTDELPVETNDSNDLSDSESNKVTIESVESLATTPDTQTLPLATNQDCEAKGVGKSTNGKYNYFVDENLTEFDVILKTFGLTRHQVNGRLKKGNFTTDDGRIVSRKLKNQITDL
jgi:hypothetical protein